MVDFKNNMAKKKTHDFLYHYDQVGGGGDSNQLQMKNQTVYDKF